MFIPLLSIRREADSPSTKKRHEKRKGGGGGGGRGGGGGGGRGGGVRGGSGGVRGGSGTSISVAGAGSSHVSRPYSFGGGRPITIASGPYAGRTAGGGDRNGVVGTKQYGSGYPGLASRGVAGRPFPYMFWPVAYGGVGGVGAYSYINHNNEYGSVNATDRPGGPQATVILTGNNTEFPTTFRFLSDNNTVVETTNAIVSQCAKYMSAENSEFNPTNYTSDSTLPQPEQIIQYYRASSAALSLDGYNNSAVFQEGVLANDTTNDTPLPSTVDLDFLRCVNQTIVESIPLIDGASSLSHVPSVGLFGLVGLVYVLSSLV